MALGAARAAPPATESRVAPKAEDIHFEGEEANAGYAAPMLDLIAAAALVALSLAVMVGAAGLPVPGDLLTAPGLLPFAVAAALLLMSLGLGASALGRRRAGVRIPLLDGRDLATDGKSLLLAAAVAVYIAALQFLAFRHDIVIGGFRHTLSAFEPVSVIAIAAIIKASWRGPLWAAVLIAAGWTLTLALVFAHVFKIPLPGSF